MSDKVVESVRMAKQIGQKKHNSIVTERIKEGKAPITDTITRNSLKMFNSPAEKVKSKSCNQINALKKDCNLFSRLYIACQSRDGDLEQFFAHENQPEPSSLSSLGKLRKGTKSDLLTRLESLYSEIPGDYLPEVTVKIFDAAAIVNIIRPTCVKSFKDYASSNFLPFIERELQDVQRVDIV